MDLFEAKKTDSLEGAMTPEGIEFVLYPAGPLIRSCAYGIDLLVQTLIMVTITISLSLLSDILGIWLYLILIFLIDWFYHVVCELAFRGQSLGKRIMGIRVVRADGSPVDPPSSFLRNLLRFADTFFFLYHIAFICMVTSPAFRRLGDWAGNTLVVYTPKSLAPPRRQAADWLSELEPLAPPRPLSYDEKQALLMFARRYPLLGEARSNEIAGIYANSLRADTSAESAGQMAYNGSTAHSSTQETGAQSAAAGSVSGAGYLLRIGRKLAQGGAAADTEKEKLR
jgi:uncharacterized RDD family membrane protein YckC